MLPPLAQVYRCEREDFGQNIWDYNEVLFGTPLGEHIGNLGNILRTYWELIGNSKKHFENKGKNEKKTFHLDATWTNPSFNYNYPLIRVHTSHELTTSD